jgi:two-component system, NtrC family, nitrogen regulation sensor histidine kinase NtrY
MADNSMSLDADSPDILARTPDSSSDASTASPEVVVAKKKRRLFTPGRGMLRTSTLGPVIVLLALITGAISFFILTGLTPIVPRQLVVVLTLGANLILVICLLLLIGWEFYKLVSASRKGVAGARLQIRILGLFVLIAATPAFLVAIVAGITLDRGLDRWFSTRTQSIIENSVRVAQIYIAEHTQQLRNDMLIMATDLDNVSELAAANPDQFANFVRTQGIIRAFPGAYVIHRDLSIVVRALYDEERQFLVPPEEALARAEAGGAIIIPPTENNQIGGLVKLNNYEDYYLFVVREIDSQVLQHLANTGEVANEYQNLENRRFGLQVAFGLIYLGMALILMLSAVWLGLWFGNRLVAPIRRLIGAAKNVSEGQLDIQVPVKTSEGELGNLGATFNDMTKQLREQRGELLEINETLDRRRRFTETVLAGVTAGVIGLDVNKRINLLNQSAQDILGLDVDSAIGKPLSDMVPELSDLVEKVAPVAVRNLQGQITLKRRGEERTISFRVSGEFTVEGDSGVVITLDDISELVSAQRTSAWADIARRIAHEIKNPLTPIQLSAERLRRKYSKVIVEDRDVFDQCTETIIRQVGDIGRMVDEFSSFARMPKAVMGKENVGELIRQATFLTEISQPNIDVSVDLPDEPIFALCDRRLISQAVTNLIKNASEAIGSSERKVAEQGWIKVNLAQIDERIRISVIDNGRGLPVENRAQLLEPYMTTRDKGTGLGLAIVSKIAEEHAGFVTLHDAPQVADGGQGAMIRIECPVGNFDQIEGDAGERETKIEVNEAEGVGR